jgi:hypothetical protein
VKEFTLTGEYKLADWLTSRLELRDDWSNKAFFEDSNGVMSKKNQPTVLLGLIAYFGPKK